MRHHTVKRVQRFLILICLAALGGIVVVGAGSFGIGLPDASGIPPQAVVPAAFKQRVVLISGHAGYDSGAVCTDAEGNVTLTEAAINARIADLAKQRLRRAGADVEIFEEFDPRLVDLDADVFLSLHADSCIDARGFKAAYHANDPSAAELTLLSCIEQSYAEETGLALDPNTVTVDMTSYHAFRRVDEATPAVILEMGFLGGDRALLEAEPQRVALGITESILCFFRTQGSASGQ